MTCISSLLVQDGEKEIIICDNSDKEGDIAFNKKLARLNPCIRYLYTGAEPDINAGYKAQNIGLDYVKGDWLCFPSEDTYYVPGFSRVMLDSVKQFDWDIVYCDWINDPRFNCVASEGTYEVVRSYPRFRFMDKNNWIVKRKLFKGFKMNEYGYGDWIFVEDCINRGAKHGRAPGVLVVHN